jgi:hypothetical protein
MLRHAQMRGCVERPVRPAGRQEPEPVPPVPAGARPPLDQLDFACERLLHRLAGPLTDGGDGGDFRAERL